jgi:MFS family permease
MALPESERSLGERIFRVVGAQFGVHACMSGLRMGVPLMVLDLGQGAAAAGFALALFGLGQILLSLPAGHVADRYGVKRPVYVGMAIAIIGAAIAAVWPIYPVLCLTAFLEGAAIAVVVVAIQRQAGRLSDDVADLRRVFAWLTFGPAAANFAGPLLVGLVIDAAGFQAAFMLQVGIALMTWPFIRLMREYPATPSAQGSRQGAWALWRDPVIRRVLSMNWFVSATWDLHTVMLPLLGHARGLSAGVIGGILGAFALAAALIRLVTPAMAARVKEWVLLSFALGLAAVLLALYPLMSSVVAMAVCSILIGAAVGSVQPLVMGLLHQITPPDRQGQAAGLRMVMINASSISMPVLAGSAGGLVGVAGVFWVGAALMAFGARQAVGLRSMLDRGKA